MVSPDRELFGIKVRQQSKTEFLNLSDLQNAYNVAAQSYGWSNRRLVTDVLGTKENSERIYYILNKQGLINMDISMFIEEVEINGMPSTLKRYSVYKTTGARHTKTTWCNPYIWVLVAMELNPMLYAETVSWLTDGLLISRIEAGNFYKAFAIAVANLANPDYSKIAKALNHVVFGKHETAIRNFATREQLKELASLESKLAFAIDMGYIGSQEELLVELRRVWNKKYNRKFLEA